MRHVIACLLCIGCCSLMGCTLIKKAKKHQEDAISEYHDDWKNVGAEARGEMPRSKETDGLTPWVQSPEARAIEKNLGYD